MCMWNLFDWLIIDEIYVLFLEVDGIKRDMINIYLLLFIFFV